MKKHTVKLDPKIYEIFNDLEEFLDFCRSYGYRYDEADLYNWKSYAYQQFAKHQQGKSAKDMWSLDTRRSA